jgi:hypothetical protein
MFIVTPELEFTKVIHITAPSALHQLQGVFIVTSELEFTKVILPTV